MKAPLLTIPQVRERLNVSERTVRRLIASGKLRAAQIGSGWRVDEGDLEAYSALQRAAAHGDTVEAAVQRSFDADRGLGNGMIS